MPELVVKGGTVIDVGGERRADVVIDEQGLVVAVGSDLSAPEIIDADGCFVAPGLVDLRARLGEPGNEQAETLESATRSAALGGYTTVLAMPDTEPATDSAPMVRDVLSSARHGLCHVEVAGAITVGLAGEQLAPLGEMAAAGVRVFSDGARSIQDARLLRRAMEYAGGLGVTLSLQCEQADLAAGGHMHEGAVSALLGIPGIPAEAEELMVMRGVALSRLTGARVHFQALSTAGSIGILRAAKGQGLMVSADVTPHHLVLTDDAVSTYDARFKLSPPLRPAEDVAHVRAGVVDGSIAAIASDHTPHEPQDKEMPFDLAPAGGIALETTLAVALTELDMKVPEVLALLSWGPARVLGLDAGREGKLEKGQQADLVVVDPAAEWTVSGAATASRSASTPFEGRKLRGRVRHTIVSGEAVVIDGEAQR